MPEHNHWDELLERELRRLPPFTAPVSLTPRIMAAVRAKAAVAAVPWWLQSWSAWPAYARAALFVAALLIASLFFSGSVVLDNQVRTMAAQNPLSGWLAEFSAVGNTVGLLWQKIGQPLFVTRLAVCVAMYFVCVGLGTAMFRVVTRQNLE
jgi:hypothetical protein